MKRMLPLLAAVAITCLLSFPASAGEKVVEDRLVTIPFAAPGGVAGRSADMTFRVPVPGTYYISLQVDRASWDAPGIADAVPIGLGAHVLKFQGQKPYNPTPWNTGLGLVTVEIYVADAQDFLQVNFSTSAPLGARGKLTIEKSM